MDSWETTVSDPLEIARGAKAEGGVRDWREAHEERRTSQAYRAQNDADVAGNLGWCVIRESDEHVVGGPFVRYTEAEAEIIAFALNAVAAGHGLRMMHKDAMDFGSMARLDRIYDGPTEGVG